MPYLTEPGTEPGDLPRSAAGLALFLDIDGTLIDIAPTPDSVVIPPGLPAMLAALHERTGGALALLTGRDLMTVDAMFAPFRLPVGAIHGALLRDGDGRVAGAPPHPALDAVRRRLETFATERPTALVEDKGNAIAVHFRLDPSLAGETEAVVRAAAAEAGEGLSVQPGKMVFEIRPSGADKGRALAAFMGLPAFRGRRPVAVGDDLTDESMFRVALETGGLALRVGVPPAGGRSVAQRGFDGTAAVRDWLATLV